jgi:hypothetical protein
MVLMCYEKMVYRKSMVTNPVKNRPHSHRIASVSKTDKG